MSETLTLIRPDDWHLHLRDKQALTRTVADAARTFARAVVMPNLVPPVTGAEQALAYKTRILAQRPPGSHFEPLMVLYLTDNTTLEDVASCSRAGVVAAKLYPAGATTNSDSGVTDIKKIYPVLEAMQRQGMLLLLHGEVTDAAIDIFDREKIFIERTLIPLCNNFPQLKVVLEHITTQEAAQYVAGAGANLGATITAHHLLYNRNHMLAGGIRPHYYCLPILKRNSHQQALVEAATSGNPKFFLGTDSAPHTRHTKENACGCAGCYTAFAAIELYAEIFEQAGALAQLEAFASLNGADFYGLPYNQDRITLVKEPWTIPATLPFGDTELVPLRAGQTLNWRMRNCQD